MESAAADVQVSMIENGDVGLAKAAQDDNGGHSCGMVVYGDGITQVYTVPPCASCAQRPDVHEHAEMLRALA